MSPPGISLPDELAVALVYNGSTAAVMMASPHDLTDFLRGFALSEGIVADPSELREVEILRHPNGIELRGRIPEARAEALAARRRASVGPVGCGLCGIESLDAAMVAPGRVSAPDSGSIAAAGQALAALDARQVLRRETRALHAAGFFDADGLHDVREDIGRHNALDKLIGARSGRDNSHGGVLITARLSLDLVQKCARGGIPVLVSVSTPTRAAVGLARACGMYLATLGAAGEVMAWTEAQTHE